MAASSPSPTASGVEAVAVAAGGALGAGLRQLAVVLTAGPDASAPAAAVSTLGVNLAGAFLLGVLVARLDLRPHPAWLRPFLAVGLLGAFTTWSGVLSLTAELGRGPGLGTAALHLFGSLALGLLAFKLGSGWRPAAAGRDAR